VHRELGQHDAEIENLKQEVAALRKDVASILSILNQTKGSWKTLVAIAGVSSAIGAAVVKFAPFLLSLPK
jgi:hypothetical protein